MRKSVMNERTLEEILNSDDELTTEFNEASFVPAYQDESRFEYLEDKKQNKIPLKDGNLSKGISNKNDAFCIKSFQETPNDNLENKKQNKASLKDGYLSKGISNKNDAFCIQSYQEIPNDNLENKKQSKISLKDGNLSKGISNKNDAFCIQSFQEMPNDNLENKKQSKTSLKDVNLSKGIFNKNDAFCIQSFQEIPNDTLLWFFKFLLLKDIQSNYKFLKSCLVPSYEYNFCKETSVSISSKETCGRYKIIVNK